MTELITNYRGAKITHIHKGTAISVTAAVDHSLKLQYDGPVCVDHLTNSYRYGEEVHLVVYQKQEPRAVFRRADSRDWFRIEAHFKLEQFDALCLDYLRYRGLVS